MMPETKKLPKEEAINLDVPMEEIEEKDEVVES